VLGVQDAGDAGRSHGRDVWNDRAAAQSIGAPQPRKPASFAAQLHPSRVGPGGQQRQCVVYIGGFQPKPVKAKMQRTGEGRSLCAH